MKIMPSECSAGNASHQNQNYYIHFDRLEFSSISSGMSNFHAREQFVKQFEAIVDGVRQTRTKVSAKYEDEKTKRDALNAHLSSLVEQQRKYATAVKQFTKYCERNNQLVKQWKALQQKHQLPSTQHWAAHCAPYFFFSVCACRIVAPVATSTTIHILTQPIYKLINDNNAL